MRAGLRPGFRYAPDYDMIMTSAERLVFLLQLGIYVSSLSTDPPVATNGGTVDLPAVENATNVNVFCEVTFNDSGNNVLVTTGWRLGLSAMTTQSIQFNEPDTNFVLENVTRSTNLTILSFTRA